MSGWDSNGGPRPTGSVALRALAFKMRGGTLGGVAANAIRRASRGVIEDGSRPGNSRLFVAGNAVTSVMIGGAGLLVA